ncbi:MAG: methanethiol S-methyltransferase [Pseudomonadota bacterium]
MKRFLIFLYGCVSYVVFFATFLYAVGFIGNILVPKSIDSVPQAPLGAALFINALLLGVFAIQHSVMARPFFKRWITRWIPEAAERSTYVLMSSLAMVLMFALWEPMGGVIWAANSAIGQKVAYGLFAFGWLLVFYSSFAINHFDLFGLRQSWQALRGHEQTAPKFVQPWLYRVVRHPLYVGWFFIVWATPVMTVAHLVFACGCSLYMLIGIQLEERDLADEHAEYAAYKKRVPMLIPSLRRPLQERLNVAVVRSGE